MLYDPQWEQPTKAKPKRAERGPSLAGFISWLRKKPESDAYDWGDTDNCACAQYFKGDWRKHDVVERKDGIRLDGLAIGYPRTYGALLERAMKAQRMGRAERGITNLATMTVTEKGKSRNE